MALDEVQDIRCLCYPKHAYEDTFVFVAKYAL